LGVVVTFWLFAQTKLNIAPDMGKDLCLDAGMMNVAMAAKAFDRRDGLCESRSCRLRS
jgi:hypothetical protein